MAIEMIEDIFIIIDKIELITDLGLRDDAIGPQWSNGVPFFFFLLPGGFLLESS